jgi:holo-[acyl-carrier protein] synthase
VKLKVGVDLVAVAEVADSLRRHGTRYATRLFTPAERAYCESRKSAAPDSFAARFAAKEAMMKVLEAEVPWRDIEVVRGPLGACSLALHRAARTLAKALNFEGFSVSLSHEGGFAIAVVTAWGDLSPRTMVVRRLTKQEKQDDRGHTRDRSRSRPTRRGRHPARR